MRVEHTREALELLDSWINDDTEPTQQEIEQAYEFMRGIDSLRPHRPLFQQYLK